MRNFKALYLPETTKKILTLSANQGTWMINYYKK